MPPRLDPHVLAVLGEALRATCEREIDGALSPELALLAAELDRSFARVQDEASCVTPSAVDWNADRRVLVGWR